MYLQLLKTEMEVVKMKRTTLRMFTFFIVAGAVASSSASPFFHEKFINRKGTDAPISSIKWHGYYGTDAKSVDEENTDIYGGIVVAAAGFIAAQFEGFTGQPVLIWTDKEKKFASADQLASVHVTMKNESNSVDFRIALKVDGKWYVSQDVVNAKGVFTECKVEIDSSKWNSLVVESGIRMEEGGAVDFPRSGNVEAVGLFDSVGGPTGYAGRFRVSDYILKVRSLTIG
jgi:hypothetical protein